jgi:hypothetical protein
MPVALLGGDLAKAVKGALDLTAWDGRNQKA